MGAAFVTSGPAPTLVGRGGGGDVATVEGCLPAAVSPCPSSPLPVLALPVLVGAALVGVAGPASADVTGTTSTSDVVLYDHCQQHPISYDLLVGPTTPFWRLEVQVADPDGHVSEGTVLNSATNPPTSGTIYYSFCGSEAPGTYTVRATGRYGPLLNLTFLLPDTTFQVRPAATRTTLAKTTLGHGRYRLDARVSEETENGFGKSDGVTVRFERLVRGEWKKFAGQTLTTVRGKATATVDARPGTRMRAVVRSGHNYAGSTSKPVTLGG